MIIESLELKNYRNYKELHINFESGDQCALWRQCPGKNRYPENLSMYVATTKSHRGSKDREIIEFGEEEPHY